jgi:carboxypeptidase Q
MKRIAILFGTALVTLAAAQGDPNTVDKLITLGKTKNRAFNTLETFTAKFGPRLTGSPELERASLWAVEEFKKYGLTNVRRDKWGEVPVGFTRGKSQVVRMVAPWKMDMVFTTPAWTPGTKGKIEIEPVVLPESMEELNKIKDSLADKWILMRRVSGIRGPQGQPSEVERAMDSIPHAGRIFGAGDERVHTGGRFMGLSMDKLPTTANVRVRKSDHDAMMLAVKAGRPLKLEMDIDNRFVGTNVAQYNIIADIPGTEKPDEVVIICGHFDSWNGPGSTGANDNGTGSSVTLEAARLLMQSGAKPKRTIRFILWTGEEQGLLGSRAYVEKYKSEMEKISAVFNDDGGTNYQGGYNCLESMVPILKAAIEPVQKAFPDFPMALNVQAQMPRGGSSDHAPFVWAGVPGFFTIEAGTADYGFVWHTQHDRPEFSRAEYLTQSSTNAAVVAYNVACADKLLPRVPIVPPTAGGTALITPVGGTKVFFDPAEGHTHDDGHDHEDEFVDYAIGSILRWLGIQK